MSLAACISRCPSTTRLPCCLKGPAPVKGSSTEALGLLRLQEQGVLRVGAEQQQDPGTGSDAAHSDDLVSGVHEAIPLDQLSYVAIERSHVGRVDLEKAFLDRLRVHALEHLLDRDD